MTETKPKGKRSAAKKATAEKKAPEAKAYEWRGLTLTLPAQMPGELLFDFAAFEELMKAGEERVGPLVDLLRSLVGESQVRQIRAKIAEAGVSFDDIFEEIQGLLNGLLGEYGLGLGKSSASRGS